MIKFKEFERYFFCYSTLVLSGVVPIEVDADGNSKIKWKNLVVTILVSLILSFNALIKVMFPFFYYTCTFSKWQIFQEIIWLITQINNVLLISCIIRVQVPYMKHIKRSGNWDELQLKSNYKPKRWKIVLRHFIICIIFAITDIKYYFEYDEEAKKIDFSKCFIHQHAQNSVIYYIGITLVDISGSCYHVLPHLTLIWMTLLIDVNIMQLQELEVKFEEIRNVERISVEILRAFHIIAEIKENFAKYFSFTTLIWSFASFLHILGHMNVIWDNPEVTEVIDTVISILIIWWWTTELQKLTQEVDSLKNVIAKLCFLELNFREKHFQQINMFLNELKQSPPQITAYQYFVIDKKFFIVVISTLATYSIILFQFH
ncbi:hypothetical protein GQR58_023683 [Nymphon striatum]|nr:hypothetical protein GQR58_023683 [Nymphon striatum]